MLFARIFSLIEFTVYIRHEAKKLHYVMLNAAVKADVETGLIKQQCSAIK